MESSGVSSRDGFAYCAKAEKVLSDIRCGVRLKHVDLSDCGLSDIPDAVFQLGDCLEILNLGGNMISKLSDSVIALQKLRILFFAQNCFTEIPSVLGKLSSLYMLSFKCNKISFIDEESLSEGLGWLILTDNKISALPSSIGKLTGLRKLMLAGNEITSLTNELQNCKELELVRLAANKLDISSLPDWFLGLPKLSWLALAGNSDLNVGTDTPDRFLTSNVTNIIDWKELEILEKLGEGASGIIYKAKWTGRNEPSDNAVEVSVSDKKLVAVKIFKGGKTSDGLPEDEMKASEAAGSHPCSFEILGRIVNSPASHLGIVMPLIPTEYSILGGPPSFESVTRDTFEAGRSFRLSVILCILRGICDVCRHLHSRGISHGDIYAHNILVNSVGKPYLCDFGAATTYDSSNKILSAALENLEVRAFGCLVEDLLDRLDPTEDIPAFDGEKRDHQGLSVISVHDRTLQSLRNIQERCLSKDSTLRPRFEVLVAELNDV